MSIKELEIKLRFRHKDGVPKRFLDELKAFDVAKSYNIKNRGGLYKASVVKMLGEKGDHRVYFAVRLSAI